MLNSSREPRSSAVGMAALIAALTLSGAYIGTRIVPADYFGIHAQAVPTDEILPSHLSVSPMAIPEEYEILMADVIAYGIVTDVSESCWNTDDCTYHLPSEEWGEDDELLSWHAPVRYFTVTFAISDTLHDSIGVTSTITFVESGPSPADPQPPTYLPYELVRDQSTVVAWNVDQPMVVMLQQEDEWVVGSTTRTVLVAPIGAQYLVNEDETLVNLVSAVTDRSVTLSDLIDHVGEILDP